MSQKLLTVDNRFYIKERGAVTTGNPEPSSHALRSEALFVLMRLMIESQR